MDPGGRYPPPGLVTAGCLCLIAIACVIAGSYIVMVIAL